MPDIKLGSLFDGIGVFPLAASRCGIRPVWASEIEKAPISITKRHFPDMVHLGDITKVDGGKIPPVHVITFGSPCQNLSLIGNRSGLAPITLWPGSMRCWLTGTERRNEPMFEAYITNTALYPLMGIEVGTTVHFPMTTQELQAALAKIGIDGKRYSEVFFTSFDSDVLGLYDHLYECENIDELNELGHALLEVRDKGGLETFEAALVLGNHTRSVKDLINLTQK